MSEHMNDMNECLNRMEWNGMEWNEKEMNE